MSQLTLFYAQNPEQMLVFFGAERPPIPSASPKWSSSVFLGTDIGTFENMGVSRG